MRSQKEDRKLLTLHNLAILLIVVLPILAFFPIISNEMVYNDIPVIENNPFIKDFSNIGYVFLGDSFTDNALYSYNNITGTEDYRPLSILTIWITYAAFQNLPIAYTLFNLLLLIGAGILIYLSLRMVLQREDIPSLAALIFLLHPIVSQTVNIIIHRDILLSLIFMLGGFLFYFNFRRFGKENLFPKDFLSKPSEGSIRNFVLSCVFFFLALLCHEDAAVFLFYIPLFDWIYIHLAKEKRQMYYLKPKYWYYLTNFCILFVVSVWRYYLMESPDLFPDSQQFNCNFFACFWGYPAFFTSYISLLVLPIDLKHLYDLTLFWKLGDPFVLTSLLVIILLILFTIWIGRSSKAMQMGSIMVIIALALQIHIIPKGGEFFSAHHGFIALLGLGFVVSAAIFEKVRWFYQESYTKKYNLHRLIIIISLLLPLFALTFYNNLQYKSNLVLLQNIADQYDTPPSDILINISKEHQRQGNINKSIEVLKQVVKQDPENSEALFLLGITLVELNQYEEAIPYFEQLTDIEDYTVNSFSVYYLLGTSQYKNYLETNDSELLSPALANLLNSLSLLSNLPEDIHLPFSVSTIEIMRKISRLYVEMEDCKSALEVLEIMDRDLRASGSSHTYLDVYYYMGLCHKSIAEQLEDERRQNNEMELAKAHFQLVLDKYDKYPDTSSPQEYVPLAFLELGKIYLEADNDTIALEYFEQAKTLDPELPEIDRYIRRAQ